MIYRFGQYEEIVDSIKEKCDYVDVIGVDGIDYVVYRCIESRFEGDIGFVIYDGSGLIRYFPKE